MLNEIKLPETLVEGGEVRKLSIKGIDEIQFLSVDPKTVINLHGHVSKKGKKQWEIWIWFSKNTVYICPKGEEHELVNESTETLQIMAIKGHSKHTFGELAMFFSRMGYTVCQGSLIVSNEIE